MIKLKRRRELIARIHIGEIRSSKDFKEYGVNEEEGIFINRIIKPDHSFTEELENGINKIRKQKKLMGEVGQNAKIEILAYDTNDTEQINAWTTIENIEEDLEKEEAKNDTSVVYDVFLKQINDDELEEYIRIGEYSSVDGFEFIDTLD